MIRQKLETHGLEIDEQRARWNVIRPKRLPIEVTRILVDRREIGVVDNEVALNVLEAGPSQCAQQLPPAFKGRRQRRQQLSCIGRSVRHHMFGRELPAAPQHDHAQVLRSACSEPVAAHPTSAANRGQRSMREYCRNNVSWQRYWQRTTSFHVDQTTLWGG